MLRTEVSDLMFISVSSRPPRENCPEATNSFEGLKGHDSWQATSLTFETERNKERSEIVLEKDFRALNEQEGKESNQVQSRRAIIQQTSVTHRSNSPTVKKEKSRSWSRENNSVRIIKKIEEDEEPKSEFYQVAAHLSP